MSKKFLTKFLNASYRKRVISSISPKRLAELKIPQYARYTVDKVIISRDKSRENDREWAYGFSPLEVLAYVSKDGKLVTRLFEFNTVNHFLREKDGDSAVEVVTAILVDWAKSDKNIRDFDIDEIDAGLKKIEDEYAEEQKEKEKEAAAKRADIDEIDACLKKIEDEYAEKEKEAAAKRAEEAGRNIKEKIEEAVNSVSGMPFEEAKSAVFERVRPVLDALVSGKDIFEYELGCARNTEASKAAGAFLLDVGFRAEEGGEAMTLRCDVRPPAKGLSAGGGD